MKMVSINPYELYYRSKSEKDIMNSIEKECSELKRKYDVCYTVWFTDRFLKGDTNEEMCAPLFNLYQQCLKKSMKENNINIKEIESDNFEIENKNKEK